ncbi:hypothetical protein OIU79_003776 [Salix purpurea]|uniref:Endonuclease/exonuclease/phosphatase domain-containing protein n=1 Tax=Salix purpurea TaxID=77065 RepID=A0A9Q0U8M6_SALPP|nr:hypothetical protein OIU79_003776 [Salix purpurea]
MLPQIWASLIIILLMQLGSLEVFGCFGAADLVSLRVIAHASQSITALVHVQNKCWLLTVVYANPNPRIHESLWTYFDGLAKASNLPWLVMGDFNDIVCASEKCGGNHDSGGSAFVDWIDRNHLIDLGFSGSKFTWCNKRNAEGIIWKQIDRGLSNSAWRLLFPEAHLSHLTRINSDHCPIMIRLDSNHSINRGCIPFRFQAMWLSHPDFATVIRDSWNFVHEIIFARALIWATTILPPKLFPKLLEAIWMG